MKNFIQEGNAIDVVAGAAVVSGQPLLVGASLFGICGADAASGQTVAVWTRGVYSVPKATGQTWTVGATLFWDNTAGKFTSVSNSTAKVAAAVTAAASADTVGTVRLNGIANLG